MNEEFTFAIVEQFTKNYIRKHFWKIERIMAEEDVIQEANIIFLQLVSRLTRRGIRIDNNKHLMSLWKTQFARYFINLANADTKRKPEVLLSDFDINATNEPLSVGDLVDLLSNRYNYNDGYFERVVEEAPKEVKQVLLLLLNAPQEVVQTIFSNKLFTNCKLCQMLGYDPKRVDLVETVQRYFS